jgi:hypothetical protein
VQKNLSPGVIAAIIAVVVIIVAIVGWKMLGAKNYSGGPIKMGEVMGNAAGKGGPPPSKAPGGPQ